MSHRRPQQVSTNGHSRLESRLDGVRRFDCDRWDGGGGVDYEVTVEMVRKQVEKSVANWFWKQSQSKVTLAMWTLAALMPWVFVAGHYHGTLNAKKSSVDVADDVGDMTHKFFLTNLKEIKERRSAKEQG